MTGVRAPQVKLIGAILLSQPSTLNDQIKHREIGELLDCADRTIRMAIATANTAPAGVDPVAHFLSVDRGVTVTPEQLAALKAEALRHVAERFAARQQQDARRAANISRVLEVGELA